MSDLNSHYKIVGHRGNPAEFPENTIDSVISAISLGADAVEVDLQMSRDGVCMVLHDLNTMRTADWGAMAPEHNADLLEQISVHEPNRFGQRHFPCYLSSLSRLVDAIAEFPVQVFLELKEESLHYFSRETFVRAVLAQSEKLGERRTIISYDLPMVELARRMSGLRVGWVLHDFGEQSRLQAQRVQPEYLIIDYIELTESAKPLWQGRWQWFVYDVVNVKKAQDLVARGVSFIETWQPSVFAR
ncbi:glycerophosphodiester phosphodiesterase family protein [Teredinibacter franksiae]|uniref:glycerophosphodiester phosphodiesterase family protein n=1 Tax=Teredinibacter franksiae TaxID=2761453 RepID=UPI0016294882|nr:glycerophosphodiester phosphodiesterase family protein [Teredinibacter franksiae]